jgi:hypothetical protein
MSKKKKMSFKKKYDGKRLAIQELDNYGRPIPSNLKLNVDLLEHIDPNETDQHSLPYYRVKKYLRYKIKQDDRDILDQILRDRLSKEVFSARRNR